MNSSRLVIWVAPSSMSILPKNGCSNSTRCWCSVCCSYSTLSTWNVMRKPRSSNSVSAIQRFSVTRFPAMTTSCEFPIAKRPGLGPAVPIRARPHRLCGLAAQQFADADALRGKCLAQHRDARVRIGRATHENVEGGVASLRPCMDGDVTFGQHGHAGHAVWLEMMQVDVQQRRGCGAYAAAQRGLDVLDVIEPLGTVQIDDQMHAGAADAVTNRKMVLAVLVLAIDALAITRRHRRCHFEFDLPVVLS